jgi:hypothetical protein
MPRKATLKKLREFADNTTSQLDGYFMEMRNRYSPHQVNNSSLGMSQRVIDAGSDMDKAVSINNLLERSLMNDLGNFLTGRAADLPNVVSSAISKFPELQNIQDEGRWVEIEQSEVELLAQAQGIVKKLHPDASLAWTTTRDSYRARYNSIDGIHAGKNERPGWSPSSGLQENPKYQASQLELTRIYTESLKPAQRVLSTRVRRHGGKIRFWYVDNMVERTRNLGLDEDAAKELFDAVVQQVEDSLNQFANLLVNRPELMSLSAELKDLKLQAEDFDEEADEDYLELV